MSADIKSVIGYLRSLMNTDPRDWSVNRRDAILYGIIVGWTGKSINEIAYLHNFSDEIMRSILEAHDVIDREVMK